MENVNIMAYTVCAHCQMQNFFEENLCSNCYKPIQVVETVPKMPKNVTFGASYPIRAVAYTIVKLYKIVPNLRVEPDGVYRLEDTIVSEEGDLIVVTAHWERDCDRKKAHSITTFRKGTHTIDSLCNQVRNSHLRPEAGSLEALNKKVNGRELVRCFIEAILRSPSTHIERSRNFIWNQTQLNHVIKDTICHIRNVKPLQTYEGTQDSALAAYLYMEWNDYWYTYRALDLFTRGNTTTACLLLNHYTRGIELPTDSFPPLLIPFENEDTFNFYVNYTNTR